MPLDALDRDLRGCIRSRETAEAHFVAEITNDADVILKSMKSYDPLLTSVVVPGDADSLQLKLCTTREQQRDFYVQSRSQMHMVGVELFTSIGSDWYGFVHGLATTEVLATKQRSTVELVGLLPSSPDEDTIAGEIGLSWPASLGKLGDAPGELANERVATMRVHRSWLDTLRAGDPDRIADLYSEGASFAMRNPLTGEIEAFTGRQAIADYYRRLFDTATVTSADIVLRTVDRWYVFCELLVELEDRVRGPLLARLADVCVVGRDDLILVHLGTSAGPPA